MTIKEAKARLNELVEAAVNGEQVVLMRGSKHVAAIVPITEAEIEIAPRLTDDQAGRLWRLVDDEARRGDVQTFASAESAVAHLAEAGGRRERPMTPRRAKSGAAARSERGRLTRNAKRPDEK